MLLENNSKKYKETPEGFKKIVGLVGLTAAIIITFIILNIFFGESDKTVVSDKIVESDKTSESDKTLISSLPKGRLNFFEELSHLTEYLSILLPLSKYNCCAL